MFKKEEMVVSVFLLCSSTLLFGNEHALVKDQPLTLFVLRHLKKSRSKSDNRGIESWLPYLENSVV